MKLKSKESISLHVFAILVASIFALIIFPDFLSYNVPPLNVDSHLTSRSLDVSWVVTQSFANFNNLIWGKEFVFTYGPLSPLGLRVPWGESLINFLLFDLFFLINIFSIVYLSLVKNRNKLFSLLTLSIIILVTPNFYGGDYAILYFFILFFWIIQSIESSKTIYFINQILIVTLLFFFKFNTCLISIVVFFLSASFQLYDKKISLLKYSIVLATPLILIFVGSKLLDVDLYSYIYFGLEIVKGYNEIMYLHLGFFSKNINWVILFGISAVLFLMHIMYHNKAKNTKTIFITGIFMLCLYVLYKQSFVRGDIEHIEGFFQLTPFLLFCTSYFYSKQWKYSHNIMLVTILLIPLLFNREDIKSNLETKKLSKTNYINGLKQFNSDFGYSLKNSKNLLPENVLNDIGNSTVDIYPWDILLLLENNLNYLPRPVIQSYTAYTKALENLNFEHYNSENGPEYVIYQYRSIDNRYPLFDEPKLNLVLQYNYEPLYRFNFSDEELVLLKRKSDFKPIKLQFEDEYAIKVGAPLVPKENTYYEVELYPKIKGKLYSVLRNYPEIKLKILDSDFNQSVYKTSNALLQTGIYSKTIFDDTDDIYYNFSADTTFNGKFVKAYYFSPENKSHFKDRIRIKEYKIKQ